VKTLCLLITGGVLAIAGSAFADGDPVKGKAVFRQCQSCHSVEDGANRIGPDLFHVVGRPAASVPDYSYSDAMKAFGAAGHKWDEATLAGYLQAPRDYIPDVKMMFVGLRKPEDIANVIAYLKNPAAVKSGW
jgi:cytochrome c